MSDWIAETQAELVGSTEEVKTRKQAEAWVIHACQGHMVCRGPLPAEVGTQIGELIVAGKMEEARDLDAKHRGIAIKQGRRVEMIPCREDLIPLIVLQTPFDGLGHEGVCPKCGVAKHWRAAWFPNLPDSEIDPQ